MNDGTSKIKPAVAMVGCGHWGKNLARNFARLGALTSVTDHDAATARNVSTELGVPHLSWEQVLESSDVDAMAIAAPAKLHAYLVDAALDAGKDVYVEKPLALDLGEAEHLWSKSERDGRVLMVGHLLQYHPAFVKLRQIVRSGWLGPLQYIYSNRLNFGKIRIAENILWSFAPHDISMILSLTGQEPNEVTAVGAYYLHGQIADVTTTHMGFPNGERAHTFVSWLHPFKEQKLVAVGETGMATFDDSQSWECKLVYYPNKVTWRDGMPVPEKADGEPVPVASDEPLKLECQHFLDCIVSRTRARTDGREGLRVLRVLNAAEEALQRQVDGHDGAAVQRRTDDPGSRYPGVTIHESAYVDDPCQIGQGTKIWHFAHVLKHTRIGRNCVLGQNVATGPGAIIGDNCKIQNNVSLYKGVILEDGVFCGPSCVFTNVMTPRAEIERKSEFMSTRVRRGATIGANATIVCGTTIGAYAMIGAGALVNRNVPDHALMAGVPARRIGWVSHAGERLGPDLICPREGRQYRQTDDDILVEVAQ